MTDLRKAAEMALEALEAHADFGLKSEKAIEALRTALAQDKQEPVAWFFDWLYESKVVKDWVTQDFEATQVNGGHNVRPLYTAPPKREWQELTDEDWHNLPTSNKQGCERDAEIFNWIEDKLKEKNT